MREVGLNAIVPTPIPSKYESRTLQSSLPQSWKSGEHAPGTPKVFPRNTQGKQLSKRCLVSVSSHMFSKNSLTFQYFPSSACSIELWCPIVQKPWVCITLQLVEYELFVSKNLGTGRLQTFAPETSKHFFSALSATYNNLIWIAPLSKYTVSKGALA